MKTYKRGENIAVLTDFSWKFCDDNERSDEMRIFNKEPEDLMRDRYRHLYLAKVSGGLIKPDEVTYEEFAYYYNNENFAEYVRRTMEKHHVDLCTALAFKLVKETYECMAAWEIALAVMDEENKIAEQCKPEADDAEEDRKLTV